jgi:ribosomal protein RSM22 (predicted rRNA methylase)
MNLPDILQEAIEQEAKLHKSNVLASATQELSHRYRDEKRRDEVVSKKQYFMESSAQRMAYILSRMPATFQAVRQALDETHKRLGQTFNSALDIGAGPGTVMWALYDLFPSLHEITMLEQDQALITLGKKLASRGSSALLRNAKWVQADVLKQESFPARDLVVISYSMGEWPEETRALVLDKLWHAAGKALLIIEPGTMAGFDVICKVRQQLIDKGAFMVAPCPHTLACPMPADDWCHFSVRVERSRMHKQAKSGSLGYEDEKFSYVAVAKTQAEEACKNNLNDLGEREAADGVVCDEVVVNTTAEEQNASDAPRSRSNRSSYSCMLPELPDARILRHPLKRSGHVSFTLCTKDQGIIKKTVSRKEGELYKEARDLEWGDSF